jgi:hypothetical protein
MAFITLRFKTAFLGRFPRSFPRGFKRHFLRSFSAFLINYKRVDLWRLKKPGSVFERLSGPSPYCLMTVQ